MAITKEFNLEGFIFEFEARSDEPYVVAAQIRQMLKEHKVVKMTLGKHIPDLRDFYNKVTESLGKPFDIAEDFTQGGVQTGERWMEIRYSADVPDMSAFRHSKNAQPLHTDESYITDPCDIMVFYCVNKAEFGGQTVFVDMQQLVARMQTIAPELLEKLTTTKVCYEKAGNKRTEYIIDLNAAQQPLVNFNYYCISPNETEENKQLNQAFFDFLMTHVRGSYLEIAVGLQPGESVFWWDHYVLHGRNPFDATETDDRLIWKTGISWE